jgi:hypothetical protein
MIAWDSANGANGALTLPISQAQFPNYRDVYGVARPTPANNNVPLTQQPVLIETSTPGQAFGL